VTVRGSCHKFQGFTTLFCGILCLGITSVLAAQNLPKFTLKFYPTTYRFFIPLQERLNMPQIKCFDPKEKSLTTVNHWVVILFCRGNNNAVSSRMIFVLGLYVTSILFQNNHTVLADILALKFYSKLNINKNMKACSILVDLRGFISSAK
jgi:hypothetical protein